MTILITDGRCFSCSDITFKTDGIIVDGIRFFRFQDVAGIYY